MFGGIGDTVSNFLSTPLYTLGNLGGATNSALGAMGGSFGPATASQVAGQGASVVGLGSALGAVGGIAGGAFGIYSGIQTGGARGFLQGAGGAAGMAAGIATLTGIGASLLPILGPLAIALPLIAMLLPGQKPSSKMQGGSMNFGSPEGITNFGFEGAKFDAGNRSQADQLLSSIAGQEGVLSKLVGFNAAGSVDVRVGNSRKEGQPGIIELRLGSIRGSDSTGVAGLLGEEGPGGGSVFERFDNNEAGIRALAERSTQLLFEAFKDAAEGVTSDMAGIVRASTSMETLTANLEFFSGAYQALQDTTLLTDRWTSALLELNAPFEAAIARANELGLSTQGLADAQAAVVADAQRRRDLQVDTLMAGLSSREASLRGDVQGAALISFDVQAAAQILQLQDAMRDLGITGEAAADALARAERILGQERLAVQAEAQRAILDAARSAVVEAYNRESAELERLASRMGNFARSLRDFRQGLLLGPLTTLSPEARLAEARSRFDDVSRRAQLGDVDAIAELQGSSQSLLEASRGYYASSEEYFADFQRVQQVLQNTESLAQRQAQIATEQLDAMRQQVEALGLLNTNILSLADAIAAFVAAGAAANAPPLAVGGPGGVVNGQSIGAQVGAGNFDLAGRASAYLAANPDVASAIAGGNLFGGLSPDEAAIAHFSMFGINEGRAFARGGMHGGGLRLVGEEGPELEVTGPARIFSAQQTRDMLRGGGNSAEVVQELRELRTLTRSLIQIVAASGDGNLKGLAAVEARLDGIERKARLEAAA
jgi:hypothetical protein